MGRKTLFRRLVGTVADCAVFGVPDPEFGESLVAYVQPAPGAAIAPAAVQAWVRERLAGYKVPRAVRIVPALPREETGKLFKRRLREAHLASASPGSAPAHR